MSALLHPVRHFFVDEAGDLTLFNKRGSIIVGAEGSSHCFLVGLCEIREPAALGKALEDLRVRLLADPYFRGVPSMQAASRKTALAFHAKDDLPEVRREVFQVLAGIEAKILVAIRRKAVLARYAQEHFRLTGRKITENLVYDDLVRRVCQNQLHKADQNHVVFARRGSTQRNAALTSAIRAAKESFNRRWGTTHDRPVEVASGVPSDHPGLQVTDYLMWALQRLLERGEWRYFEMLEQNFRLIMDVDDQREKGYGAWYSDRNPLRREKLMPIVPG